MTTPQRFNDIVATQLDINGFDSLTEQQKKLAFYLGEAGKWGRFISVDQCSKHNIPLFNNLITLYENTDKETQLHKEVHDTLFMMFSHNGIYHYVTGEKLPLPLTQAALHTAKDNFPEVVQAIDENWFNADIKQFRTLQTSAEGVDIVADSGGNFYENLTTNDVRNFREQQSNSLSTQGTEQEQLIQKRAPHGFNERLVKHEDGTIERQIISINGLYAPYVKKIVENLNNALQYAENEEQKASISTLIDFYHTGNAVDFDNHCAAWTKDKNSSIYFINGLIENYDDPLGVACGFESVVGFVNWEETQKVEAIVKNIQWFEDNMPTEARFKKTEAKGVSGFYVKAISMAGETAPALPLGINLPNSAWIKGEFGSKSINLENSASSRAGFDGELRKALYLPEYLPLIEKYSFKMNNLHTDLHEIAGHGCGKYLPGIDKKNLDTFYSVIEEARADLAALYFCADPKLQEFGIITPDMDGKDAAQALYVSYLTNGAFAQLRRINGEELTQAHFRNRQLIANWILENGDKDKVALVKENGNSYIKVNDVQHVRNLCGKLLGKIQEIKSTGDLKGAEHLVMTYGTKINQDLLKETHERVSKLNLPNVVVFTTPVMEFDENSNVKISQADNFLDQQVQLFKANCTLPLKNKLKI